MLDVTSLLTGSLKFKHHLLFESFGPGTDYNIQCHDQVVWFIFYGILNSHKIKINDVGLFCHLT